VRITYQMIVLKILYMELVTALLCLIQSSQYRHILILQAKYSLEPKIVDINGHLN